jgi:hypothetical protein
MGFYFRKSLKFGPFRVNFSKSGIGVSAGVKGARISKGPRGTFVHMGLNGIYYRKSITNKDSQNKNLSQPLSKNIETQNIELDELGTKNILDLVDSSFEEEFKIIQENYSRILFGEKKIYLFYDIDEKQEKKIEMFYSIIDTLRSCGKYWYLSAQSNISTIDVKKIYGGADTLNKSIPLYPILIRMGKPRRFITNVKVLVIPILTKNIYFFPDRLFITEGRKIGTVNYKDLIVEYGKAPTVMSQKDIPIGTEIIGHVWRYANKDGSPDKRYSSSNYKLPIANLSQLNLKSESGLSECFQFAKVDTAEKFAKALNEFSQE